jgi:nickel/cobalt transporter (NiCoT) family protein
MSMETLPTHWLSLIAVVFLLGLKHGLDPDHLAAIDGLTRFNAADRPRLSRWSGLLFSAGHGAVVTAIALAVGAAFALSFDTIGQAVLFSIAGSSLAGWMCAAALGLVFTAGMMTTDALNGLWVSRMLARSAAHRAFASRVMGGAIGAVALAIAATGAWRYASPSGAPPESWTTVLGIAVMATVAAAYGLGQMLNFRST